METTYKIFEEIDSKLGFHLITPLNMMEENKKLEEAIRAGKVYHPQYRYPDGGDCNFDSMTEKLEQIRFDDTTIGRLYQNMMLQKRKEIELFRHTGNNTAFTKACQQLYGRPDASLEKYCIRILTMETEQEPLLHSANDLKSAFQKKLYEYGLNDWNIFITPKLGSKVMVGTKKIWINENHQFSERDVLRLCAHEISTHVLRYENGLLRKDHIFADGTSGAMETEEGLAVYNEELVGALNVSMLKIYAARYLCTLHMNEASLYELVTMIQDYVGLQQAIYIASRIKVGLCDTSLPGGFNKDQIYLKGYLRVKQAIEDDREVYPHLYFGRISINDLPLLDSRIDKAYEEGTLILPKL